MSKAKNWCFTLNNYTPEDEARLQAISLTVISYLIYGRETGESGTPHLQGFVSFLSRKTLPQAIAIIGQAHLSVSRQILNSIEYCKKEGDVFEIGEAPSGQGKRNDLEALKEDIKEGMTSLKEIREHHSSCYARYPKFVMEYIRDQREEVGVENHPLRDWQSNLNALLNGPINPREIVFIVDPVGNGGKTWFFHYYCQNHENCQVLGPGKKNDMAYALVDNPRVVFIDCARSKSEVLLYDFLEEVKNGYVFCPKYESRMKRFLSPHVVIGMNQHPDEDKLSADRYNIITIS